MSIVDDILKKPIINIEEKVEGPLGTNIEFYREVKKIIPLRIEFYYAVLEALVAMYFSKTKELKSLGSRIDSMPDSTNETLNKIETMNMEIDALKIELERLNKELQDLVTERKYKEVSEKSIECLNFENKIKMLVESKNRLENSYNQSIETSLERQTKVSKLSAEIKEIITMIKDMKKGIKSISKEGKDKIDDIAIHRKHIDKIMQSIEIEAIERGKDVSSEEAKANLKKSQYTVVLFLLNYVSMIKEHYKQSESLSDDIVKAYENRELIDDESEKPRMFFGTRSVILTGNSSGLISSIFRDSTINAPFINHDRKQLAYMADSFIEVAQLLRENQYKLLTEEQIEDKVQEMEKLQRKSYDDYSATVEALIRLYRTVNFVNKRNELSEESVPKKIA